MTRIKNSDDELRKPADNAAEDQTKESDDAEGHMFMIDPNANRQVSKGRSADIDRQLRERQRAKEARPNRR